MQQQSLTLRSLSPAPVLTRKRASEFPAPLPATKKPRTITSRKNSNLNTIASDSNSHLPGSCNMIAIADDHMNPPPSNQGPSNSGSSNPATNSKHNDDDNINNNNNIDLTEGNSSNSNGDKSQRGDEDGDEERDEEEEDDDGFITLDDDGNKVTPDNMFDVVTEADKHKYLYGSWWDKDDIKVVLKWFFVPENARRYRNPGKVAGLRLKDINFEIADLVNRALDELELAKADEDTEAAKKSENQKVYDDATVRDKYRQLKAAYDKCATELSKAGKGNKRSTLLIHVIKKITPYYKELFDIFGSQINDRNTVPSRESAVNGKKTFHLNIPDLDLPRERVNSSCDDKGKTEAMQNQTNSANQLFVIRDVEAILSKMETIYATNNGGPATSTASGANSIEQRWIDRERQLLEKERAALDRERQACATERMEFFDSKEKERRYMELQQMRLERDRQDMASWEVDVREERAEMRAIKKERDIMFKRLALYEAQYGLSLSTSIATETRDTNLKNASATGTP